eukprot:scaffold6319_cov107-Isochrysis_galbana.AAC.7
MAFGAGHVRPRLLTMARSGIRATFGTLVPTTSGKGEGARLLSFGGAIAAAASGRPTPVGEYQASAPSSSWLLSVSATAASLSTVSCAALSPARNAARTASASCGSTRATDAPPVLRPSADRRTACNKPHDAPATKVSPAPRVLRTRAGIGVSSSKQTPPAEAKARAQIRLLAPRVTITLATPARTRTAAASRTSASVIDPDRARSPLPPGTPSPCASRRAPTIATSSPSLGETKPQPLSGGRERGTLGGPGAQPSPAGPPPAAPIAACVS